MSITLASAILVVRAWTRLYTSGMAPEIRDARRAEIDSDLWEFHEDARRRSVVSESHEQFQRPRGFRDQRGNSLCEALGSLLAGPVNEEDDMRTRRVAAERVTGDDG